jgi:GTPase SAR1 family protein
MNILILHLSDIHFYTDRRKNKVLERANSIAAAVQRSAAGATACFIVISGDIAFSGEAAQYEQAAEFIKGLKGALAAAAPSLAVHVVVVPGNHDCNFSTQSGTRAFILDNIGLKEAETVNIDIVREMTSVQQGFFEFESSVQGPDTEGVLEGVSRLFYVRRFDLGGYKISFHCMNLAWMSRMHEPQGQLIFPLQLVEWEEEEADLTVTVFHHPDRWLESSNSRPFREHIEHTSNLILTGHEHAADRATKRNRAGAVNEYVEGAVLQDSYDSWNSGFNLIAIDRLAKAVQVTTYILTRDGYRSEGASEWRPFEQTLQLRARRFVNNAQFAHTLAEPGLPLSHRSQQTLTLADIFIYPDLDGLPLDKKRDDGGIDLIIPGERVPTFVMENPLLIITGADQAGKTALSKMLYTNLLSRGQVPVLISGADLKSTKDNDLLKLLDRQFIRQYDEEQLKRYQQLARERRTLIVDDFDHTGIKSRDGHSAIINAMRWHFDRIIILASDLFQFAELAQVSETESALNLFRQVQIREMSNQLRYRLITKWVLFDRDPAISDQLIEHEIDDYANKMSTLVMRKTVPAYPIILLSMLQMFDLNQEVADKGEFGYFYESYIMQKLRQNRIHSIEMGTIVNFASHLAYRLFINKSRTINDAELTEFTRQYCKQFSMNFSQDNMLGVLERAEVLRRDVEQLYRFKHRFVYYYFVAKYFHLNMYREAAKNKLRKQINEMAGRIHVDDFYYILLFLVYLTNDEKIIARLGDNGTSFYAEHDPCDLDTHVQHINNVGGTLPPLSLDGTDARSNRDEYERRRDESEALQGRGLTDEAGDLADQQQLDELMKLNVAFRTLQIMGSVLRNFPGALQGDVKKKLALGSYRLGLRILKFILVIIEENAEYFKEVVAGLVKDTYQITDPEQLEKRTTGLMFELQASLGYGMVKKISQAVGSRHLKETYREVLTEDNTISVRTVDTAIKLDHFTNFPATEVIELHKDMKENHFALAILRTLVRDRFYLFTEERKLRQSICDQLGIQLNDPKMIEGKMKR